MDGGQPRCQRGGGGGCGGGRAREELEEDDVGGDRAGRVRITAQPDTGHSTPPPGSRCPHRSISIAAAAAAAAELQALGNEPI
ncbi:unnamed protein product [Urochloa humidicola]